MERMMDSVCAARHSEVRVARFVPGASHTEGRLDKSLNGRMTGVR
jgi:hypothetical protein